MNTVAPYLRTALMPRSARLVCPTSGTESQGRVELDDLHVMRRPWNRMMQAYSDHEPNDVMLALAVARLRPEVRWIGPCAPTSFRKTIRVTARPVAGDARDA